MYIYIHIICYLPAQAAGASFSFDVRAFLDADRSKGLTQTAKNVASRGYCRARKDALAFGLEDAACRREVDFRISHRINN